MPPCGARTEAATLPAQSRPRSGYLRRWRRSRRHPNERDESAASPEGFGNLWKTCSALGDSCSLRTRTGRRHRIPPPLPSLPASLPAPRWAGGGSGAWAERAGSHCVWRTRPHVTSGPGALWVTWVSKLLKGSRLQAGTSASCLVRVCHCVFPFALGDRLASYLSQSGGKH